MTSKCPICEKVFVATQNKQIYCSRKCRLEDQKNLPDADHFCKWCGKKFIPTASAQKYCSKLCAKQKAPLVKTDWNAIMKICYEHHVSYGQAVEQGLI